MVILSTDLKTGDRAGLWLPHQDHDRKPVRGRTLQALPRADKQQQIVLKDNKSMEEKRWVI